jgi:hypothetical protein
MWQLSHYSLLVISSHLTEQTNRGGIWWTFYNFRGYLPISKLQGVFNEFWNYKGYLTFHSKNKITSKQFFLSFFNFKKRFDMQASYQYEAFWDHFFSSFHLPTIYILVLLSSTHSWMKYQKSEKHQMRQRQTIVCFYLLLHTGDSSIHPPFHLWIIVITVVMWLQVYSFFSKVVTQN